MFDWIVVLIPVLPWLAALSAGLQSLQGRPATEADAARGAGLVVSAVAVSFILACLCLLLAEYGLVPRVIHYGTWLNSGDFHVHVSVLAERQTLGSAALFSGLIVLVARYSAHHSHRLVISLFAGAILGLVLADSLVLTLLAWALATVCSLLLIDAGREHSLATRHMTRAVLTHRIGEAGFGLALLVAYTSPGGIEWSTLLAAASVQDAPWAGSLALCLLIPAMAGAGLVPFSPGLTRAIEASTASGASLYGAIMASVGVFLVLRLEPLFMAAPWAMTVLTAVGLLSLLYGFLCSWVWRGSRSAQAFAIISQTGLLFLLAGLGLWQWAWWYMAAHAVLRVLQFFNTPARMHHTPDPPVPSPPDWLASQPRLYRLALRHFYLETLSDALLVKPCLSLARDCQRFDHAVIDSTLGEAGSTLRERATGVRQESTGLPGRLLHAVGIFLQRLEQHLIVHGLNRAVLRRGYRLGQRLNRLEDGLALPRYWFLWIVLTLLIT
jgi:NADH:ubiquinone oxidoreductase subunit 5 (subunit L)/multisubunit Na+/H+ antiporter MnhA subunit